MSVQSEINRIKGNIADAYTAVSGKGGTLPSVQNSANLPTAIQSIPAGGNLQPSKAVTVTQNGTSAITPDSGYGGMEKVVLAVNVSGGGGGDVYEAINRTTNVNVADENLSTIMARGIYAGTADMSAGDSLISGAIYLVYED